MDVGDTYRSIN